MAAGVGNMNMPGIKYGKGGEPVAIIGMAGIYPKAPDLKSFWRNILAGEDAIGEPVPEWEAGRYLDSGRINTPCGGYLKDLYRFDPREFGIMPNSVDGAEPDQFLAMRVAREALRDAGYLDGDYDHRDTGIVLGHSTYLHRGQGTLLQHNIVLDEIAELLQAVFPSLDETRLSKLREYLKKKLPPFNPDTVPGLVPNVMTGRIANRFNLRGPNYLLDAACSSSLIAVQASIDELRNGRSRMMLAGGVNATLPAEVAVAFTYLGALSRRGKVRPFDAGSDGTLLGEGLGIVVLKKLRDALADDDCIYAVILDVGQASDGRGHGLLAPSVKGEALAMQRAYQHANVDPSTIELIEAHGTGIPLGDQTEVAALRQVFGGRTGAQGSIAMGSVKSMISHCIPAAGIAGLIKTALALHHQILPPTLCEKVNPELGLEGTPFFINTRTRAWISKPRAPRRAGVNAFGFGGINSHVILEEPPAGARRPDRLQLWPAELCVFSADDDEALAAALKEATNLLGENTSLSLAAIARRLAAVDENRPHRLAIIARDTGELSRKILQALERLKGDGARWATRSGIVYSRSPLEGKLAFMFPGEGSQYLNMLSEIALYFEEVRDWFGFWREMYESAPGESRTDIVFPPESEMDEERLGQLEGRLHEMDVGSEAVFIASQAIYSLLASLGVRPDAMVGHSTGESSALVASGAVESDDPERLAHAVKDLNRTFQELLANGKIHTGTLLAVGALPKTVIEEKIAALDETIAVAMDNCANQIVLYGDKGAIEELQERLTEEGGICVPLPFDRGYHTAYFTPASAAFLDYYGRIGLRVPRFPLYSCATADLFPDDADRVRELAASQWSRTVRFRETVTKMHLDGVRFFVEVGPSGNLSAFVKDILAGKEFLSLTTDSQRKSGLGQFLTMLAHLYVNRKSVEVNRLFARRSAMQFDMEPSPERGQPGVRLLNTMPVLHFDEADRVFLRELVAESDSQPWDQEGHAAPVEDCVPFLNEIKEWDNKHLTAECRLSVRDDAFLRHHVLSGAVSEYDQELTGLSCVPLMVSLEILAEACALLAGSTRIGAITNIKAMDWIALDKGEVILEAGAEAIGPSSYRAGLFNNGNLVVSAEFDFEADWRVSGLSALSELRPPHWQAHELYPIGMFHGPLFQSIKRLEGWSGEGIDASLSEVSLKGFFDEGRAPRLVLNPVLLDSIGQLAAYWIGHRVGTNFHSFPTTIERIELYRQCPQDMKGLILKARQCPLGSGHADQDEGQRIWQFECVDKGGRPLFRVANLVNVYYPVPANLFQARRDPLNGWLGHPVKTTGENGALLWQLPHLPEKFCTQSNGIFMRVLAHSVLGFEEIGEWLQLTGNIRHKRQWLLGRVCIKEAVRYWVYRHTDRLLYPADILVSHDGLGAPQVDGLWNDLIQPPEVSLSHDGQLSLAAVTPPLSPVGVDIEPVGRIGDPGLFERALSPAEKVLLCGCDDKELGEKMLRIWCAKEAAAKCLGLGLLGEPGQFEVSFVDEGLRMAQVNYGGNLVDVDIRSENGLVIALATGNHRLMRTGDYGRSE